METHITLDLGNSNPHMGIFSANKLTSIEPFSEDKLNSYKVPLLISQVGAHKLLESKGVSNKIWDFSEFFKQDSFLSMPVNYSKTLGQDRLYLAYFVYKNFCQSHKPKIIIDAGTFMTIDLVSNKGFLGGFIFPGFKALSKTYEKGFQLPDLNYSPVRERELPNTTEKAMNQAMTLSYVGIFKTLLEQNTECDSLFLTGGSGEVLSELIDEVFSNQEIIKEPHLIHHALTYIFTEVCS